MAVNDDGEVWAVHGSVDWLTATYKSSNKRVQVKQMANNLIEAEVVAGNRTTTGSFSGYQTMACGRCLWGEREDGFLVRLSSDFAQKYWLSFLAYSSNITRIDLAATAFFVGWQKDFVKESYEQAVIGLTGEQQRKYSLIQEAKGGQTMYVGARTSAQYGRLYDKYVESRRKAEWMNAVRYEVEFKKPLSLQVAIECSKQEDVDKWIVGYVREWWLTRGVVPCYNSSVLVKAIQMERRMTDTDKRLEWLARQVHPAYQQLKMTGYEEEALRAIESGLSPTDHYTKDDGKKE